MPQEIVDYLNKQFGAGTFLLMIIAIVGFATYIKSHVDNYKKEVEDRCERENSEDNDREEKNRKLEEQLQSISDQVEAISQTLAEIKSSNDQLRKETEEQDHAITELNRSVRSLSDSTNKLEQGMSHMNDKVVLLIDNDKEDTRAFLLGEHEKWVSKGYIDVKMLDICETKFKRYLEENGNTFVEDIMKDLRELEKRH